MHDEFRIRVEIGHEQVAKLLSALESVERDGELGAPSPGHIAVSHEQGHVFLYADSSEEAARARAAVERILSEQHIDATLSAWRWHPQEDRWEDASLPLPSTDAERAAEHERLEQLETQESTQTGHAGWEVRVTLPTHYDARSFAERLGAEGIPVRRHWRHLTLGTQDEDEAHALAARLRSEAPQGSTLEVEGNAWDAWVELQRPARPFAIFGGLAQ
ncbi:MAG TPA: hypothetical protein VK781_07410 [Solirubrobacteraceae bacterium]|jgi:hypothetical protein|nr:hypothetical protein [Solirubrobacteraceae bacterium]